MDTIAVQTEISRPEWDRLAARLSVRTLRTPSGSTSQKAYGSLLLSRLTVYASDARLTPEPTHRLVLEFSPGRVVYGHNVQGSELCARAALDLVLDEVEATGLFLRERVLKVCRLDASYTFVGTPADGYLAEAAKFALPRRERVVFAHGVLFKAKSRSELLYDKRSEILHSLNVLDAKMARRSYADESDTEAVSSGAPPIAAPVFEQFPEIAGLPDDRTSGISAATTRMPPQLSPLILPSGDAVGDRRAGLLRGAQMVEHGGLRVEVRVKGSTQVAKALALPDAEFATVCTDENSLTLLNGFLALFDWSGGNAGAAEITALKQRTGYTGARLLKLLGFRELERMIGTDREAYRALGLSPTMRRTLRRELRLSVHRLNEPPLPPLAVSRDDLARIREYEEGELETWHKQRASWRKSLLLPQNDWALLAA